MITLNISECIDVANKLWDFGEKLYQKSKPVEVVLCDRYTKDESNCFFIKIKVHNDRQKKILLNRIYFFVGQKPSAGLMSNCERQQYYKVGFSNNDIATTNFEGERSITRINQPHAAQSYAEFSISVDYELQPNETGMLTLEIQENDILTGSCALRVCLGYNDKGKTTECDVISFA